MRPFTSRVREVHTCGFQARPALKQNGVLFPWLAVSVHAAQRGKRLLLSPLCRERRVNSAGHGVERSGFIEQRGDLRGPDPPSPRLRRARRPSCCRPTNKGKTPNPFSPLSALQASGVRAVLRPARPSSATSAALHSFPRQLSLRLRSRLVPAPRRASLFTKSGELRTGHSHARSERATRTLFPKPLKVGLRKTKCSWAGACRNFTGNNGYYPVFTRNHPKRTRHDARQREIRERRL